MASTHIDLVRSLAELLHASDLSELEIEQDGLRVRVARQTALSAVGVTQTPPAVRDEAPPSTGRVISSPMVGTVYLAPEPGADNFVKVGDTVGEGTTLLMIEAMKTFNAVTASGSGSVTKILVSDEQPVEYGDALMVIE